MTGQNKDWVKNNIIRVRGDSLRRGRQRFRKNRQRVLLGRMQPDAWARSTQSWMAHLQHADSWRFQQAILRETNLSTRAMLTTG